MQELNILIERFSRDLDDKGLIVKSYDSDIEKIIKSDSNIFKEVKKMLKYDKSEKIGKKVMKELTSYGIGISADKLLDIIINILQ